MATEPMLRDLGVRMGMRSFRLGLTAMLLASALAGAADLAWKDRGDRYEGIRPENVSGGDFELLGVYVEPGPRARDADQLWVSVPLHQEAKLRIRVWEPKSGYAMDPKREAFQPGSSFSWSRAAVLQPKSIPSSELHVLATDSETQRFYYPARLTTAPPSANLRRYVFRFRSRGGVDLAVKISREKEGRLVEVISRRREEDFGGILDFAWDGRSSQGQPSPAGIYHLQLKGTVFLKNDLSLNIDIPFIHFGAMSP